MTDIHLRLTDVTRVFSAGGASITGADAISLDVAAGSVVGVTGPSGSGKSTLLHLIGAIEKVDSGSITVDGVEVTALRRRSLTAYRRTVGFVFQRYHLLPALTTLDNVLAPVLAYRVRYDKVARARELLEACGLAGRESAMPSQLSGGQQQRVAIARALIARPRLVLADEPTGNLDSGTGAEIMDLLLQIRQQFGTTMLIATHEQHISAQCDRLVRLRDGRVAEDLVLTDGEPADETLARISGLRP
ncbi:peptide ABC transporter ATP-binding protein [Rhizocola hellebori]|uniref:Peptide ABC transporter ATP-binding protein n=1 Tax=Rhizocola hellebori TaxID=1392758 RepID=A0A8J3Q9K5_9ACTN|nr:ABC transporter ATP-binding protein [Rhizocola hellebori]GIH06451.1 peptide ABC transporter ATP-binding protein [Rhizocola hellebori]